MVDVPEAHLAPQLQPGRQVMFQQQQPGTGGVAGTGGVRATVAVVNDEDWCVGGQGGQGLKEGAGDERCPRVLGHTCIPVHLDRTHAPINDKHMSTHTCVCTPAHMHARTCISMHALETRLNLPCHLDTPGLAVP